MSNDESLPRSKLHVAFAELAYRVVRRLAGIEFAQILRLELASIRPLRPTALELEFRFMTADEVRAAAADPIYELDEAMAARLQSGRDSCFAAWHGDRLASFAWYAVQSVEPEHSFGAGLRLPRDTVYQYKAITVPEYRGRQLHGAALSRAAAHFRQRGMSQMIAIVEFGNQASLRSHAKLGFRPAGSLLTFARRSIGWGCGTLLA
jgi:L-amino acid N-acyltransferase YncA